MNVTRGDVVLTDFPFSTGAGIKRRPVVIVQNDKDNTRLVNTIIAQITGLTRRALEPTQLLIDVSTPDGKLSGLRFTSVINCVNLFTLEKAKIVRLLGKSTPSLVVKLD